MEWCFIKETIRDAVLPTKLITVIMNLVSSSSCRLLWNGKITDVIKQTRGLRQGDTHILFVHVMYGETSALDSKRGWEEDLEADQSVLKWPTDFASIFADDILLFAEAEEDQISCIKSWTSFAKHPVRGWVFRCLSSSSPPTSRSKWQKRWLQKLVYRGPMTWESTLASILISKGVLELINFCYKRWRLNWAAGCRCTYQEQVGWL